MPRCISDCSGIRVFGRRIKSLVFSTDVAIIKNINADAVIAVYPFTPQAGITQAIIGVSDVPVFVGVGGGLTNGQRSAQIAAFCRAPGRVRCGVQHVHGRGHHPHDQGDRGDPGGLHRGVGKGGSERKLATGLDFINVSGADRTPFIVSELRRRYPELPIIATGGPRRTPSAPPFRPGRTPSHTPRPATVSSSPRICTATASGS